MSNHIHPPRDNGGIIMGVKSPAWFRAWFGEYDTDNFGVKDEQCRHCDNQSAMAAPCYLGLCHNCWTALLHYCLEVVNRQIDKHPEKWNGDERPDGLQLALYKIKRNIQLGTFDMLCAVAIDGVPNAELKAAQKTAVRCEKAMEYRRRWNANHKAARREISRRYYERNREKILMKNREDSRIHPEKRREACRRWYARHVQKLKKNND